MGSDGRIHIINAHDLRTAWPSCDELLAEIKAKCFVDPYRHSLAGVEYVHLYSATHHDAWLSYGQHHDWDSKQPMTEAETLQLWKMREFVRWLQTNATVWEVWT